MERLLVGRGLSDVTGEPDGCGMLGYGMRHQRSEGIHNRLRSRAFVFAESAGARRRAALVICDLPLMFDTVRSEVIARLEERFGDLYGDHNLLLTVTHTHCGPGGYSRYQLYDSTSDGFHRGSYEAVVCGIVEAVERAHADLAPAGISVARGELRDASVNRSPLAFARNPAADRAAFPDAIDPATVLLRIERHGRVDGAVCWFATHGTSMTSRNRLVSGDNKGYAGYAWERLDRGVDYRSGDPPPFVGAFAQSNPGDMSPNLAGSPGHGPTDDDFANTRLIGERQRDAAAELLAAPGEPLDGGVAARTVWVDMGNVVVRPEYSGDGLPHRTSSAVAGASSFAGAQVDGPGFSPPFREGRKNPLVGLASRFLYAMSPALRDAQAPKAMLVPAAPLNRLLKFVGTRVPVQVIRLGGLWLVAIPCEPTIVSGLRLRHSVAGAVGTKPDRVVVCGYSNAYFHYVTTPEEYDAQRYEGGSTVFGRWELPAFQQIASDLAAVVAGAHIRGEPLPPIDGELPPPAHPRVPPLAPDRRIDTPPEGRSFGDVVDGPRSSYVAGETVVVSFVAASPNNDLRREGTFLEVQAATTDGTWRTVADDGDWDTRIRWAHSADGSMTATVSWHVPAGAGGAHRIVYHGDRRGAGGGLEPFRGMSPVFVISG